MIVVGARAQEFPRYALPLVILEEPRLPWESWLDILGDQLEVKDLTFFRDRYWIVGRCSLFRRAIVEISGSHFNFRPVFYFYFFQLE
jgi:hypothetical protein